MPEFRIANFVYAVAISLLFNLGIACADDWPQWNGPTRDGVVRENNLLTEIPKDGLELLWRKEAGLGYSGPAVAAGQLYLFDYLVSSGKVINNPGTRDNLTGQERLRCMDPVTGKLKWTYQYDCSYSVSYGSGPRTTPTVHDGHVFILGAEGDLNCLDQATGKVNWNKSFKNDFQASTPIWGHSASPLIYNDSLICMVGGEGSMVVAFDWKTGDEKWRSLSGKEIGYCPPSLITHDGSQQLLIWDPERLSALDPNTGQVLWQQPLKPDYGMSILPPVKDGNLLYVGGEGSVGAMYQLGDAKPSASVVWTGTPRKGLFLATSSAVFDNGYLYGADIRSGALVCVHGTDGKRMWQSALPTIGSERGRGSAHGTAFLLKLKESYLIFSETGDFISAKLSPEGYQETGRFHAIDPTGKAMGRDYVWTFPAISDGKLFLRNDKEVVCYDLSAKD